MVILEPSKWVHGGYTIAYLNQKTYFVKGAIPGEKVGCEIVQEKSTHSFAIVKEIITKSKERITNECLSYPECGGCSFLSISYELERKIKQELFYQELAHKKIDFPLEKIEFHFSYERGYRNNVQFKEYKNKKGFFQEKSREIIVFPPSGCLLLPSELNQYIQSRKEYPQEGKLRLANRIYHYAKEETQFSILEKTFSVPPNGFFQINRFLIEPWIKRIVNLTPQVESLSELFCGSGLVSLFLSEKCKKIIAWESEKKSIQFAKKNAIKNKILNLNFYVLDLYKEFLPNELLSKEFWFANPPRSGLGEKIFTKLKEHKPKYFLYSSCNYTTLVRDLKIFISFGYKIENIEIFDFFPRTEYFETLVALQISP